MSKVRASRYGYATRLHACAPRRRRADAASMLHPASAWLGATALTWPSQTQAAGTASVRARLPRMLLRCAALSASPPQTRTLATAPSWAATAARWASAALRKTECSSRSCQSAGCALRLRAACAALTPRARRFATRASTTSRKTTTLSSCTADTQARARLALPGPACSLQTRVNGALSAFALARHPRGGRGRARRGDMPFRLLQDVGERARRGAGYQRGHHARYHRRGGLPRGRHPRAAARQGGAVRRARTTAPLPRRCGAAAASRGRHRRCCAAPRRVIIAPPPPAVVGCTRARAPAHRCTSGLLSTHGIACAAGLRRSWVPMDARCGVGKGSSRPQGQLGCQRCANARGPRAGGRRSVVGLRPLGRCWCPVRRDAPAPWAAPLRPQALGSGLPSARGGSRARAAARQRRGEAQACCRAIFGLKPGVAGGFSTESADGPAPGMGGIAAGPRRLEAGATHTLSLPPPWPPWASRP